MVRNNDPVILLVDDDPNDEELARIALQHCHIPHRLEVVRDGPQALDWLFGRGAFTESGPNVMPHLILLDLKLPRMNGLQVLAEIRNNPRTKLRPVVVFTSSLEERDLTESYALGANGYVRKPVSFSEYKKLVAEVAGFWIVHNQSPAVAVAGV